MKLMNVLLRSSPATSPKLPALSPCGEQVPAFLMPLLFPQGMLPLPFPLLNSKSLKKYIFIMLRERDTDLLFHLSMHSLADCCMCPDGD